MKKLLVLCGLSVLLFVSSISSSIHVYDLEQNRITNSVPGNQTVIIYNPYDQIDFTNIQQYKANLHTHTTESDGSSTPSEVIYHYHDVGGYDILSITDHNHNTWPWNEYIIEEPVSSSSSSAYYPTLEMLAISGNELSLRHHRSSLLNDYPYGGFFFHFAFWYIQQQDGLSFFNHPGRYNYDADWYQDFFDRYDDCVLGVEVYNQGDRYPNDRILWDEINKEREPDDLIWGFSNDDMHDIKDDAFRNYQYFLMNELTETDLRTAMINGSFYFSYEPNGANSDSETYGMAMTPKLIDVTIMNTIITLSAEDYDTIEWYNQDSQIIGSDPSLDVSSINSNFVRAVLINEHGKTYTQPFGIQQ